MDKAVENGRSQPQQFPDQLELIGDLQKENRELRAENQELRAEIGLLRQENTRLREEITRVSQI